MLFVDGHHVSEQQDLVLLQVPLHSCGWSIEIVCRFLVFFSFENVYQHNHHARS
jgi:hypothetical protein